MNVVEMTARPGERLLPPGGPRLTPPAVGEHLALFGPAQEAQPQEAAIKRKSRGSASASAVSRSWRHNSEPTRTQLAHRKAYHVQPVAVLELDHLIQPAPNNADNSVKEDPVCQKRGGSSHPVDGACLHGTLSFLVALGALER